MNKIKVWDLAVRLFHWALVIAFSLSCYSAFQDKVMTGYDVMHLNAGLSILILASSRFVWGFVGSTTALFTSFVRGPRAVFDHICSMKSSNEYGYVGHNPLGALFIVIILIALLVQAVMGLYSNDLILFEGPLAGSVGESLSSQITGYHEILGIILIGLAVAHLASVIHYNFIKGVDLIKPMVTGYKVVSDDFFEKEAQKKVLMFRNPLWALMVFLITGYAWCWFIF